MPVLSRDWEHPLIFDARKMILDTQSVERVRVQKVKSQQKWDVEVDDIDFVDDCFLRRGNGNLKCAN
jgi:hypothetical protein